MGNSIMPQKLVNPAMEQRIARFDKITRMVRTMGKEGIPYAKLKALICIDDGLNERTANSYIQTLKDAEKIIIHGGVAYDPEQFNQGEGQK